ncbi:NAD(P)H-binding protein [Mycobacteroides immunogenum]|uniref:NAD-dependent dehydratase n=1 Tax=Mycobacteroides immunogenum TaxID=83262 RepID=A0A7V8LNW3_9MYCO|nr:NAD(P)H-binding protein [Mycobacteroides immunogenum]AMT71913.1 NAD-dependent dehydratase [Mycobacteroides immunogenum]ANO05042.1 NAD-dependent dehydratase [Mycobacteroides immunogenum]KIU37813.1 NAD-dependent dehydratase [Mycobacteroides immunogenum]KPG07074.1 NAD-dependent dehydratase [Mycobacteroides immunogenum]KPG07456.1 NAD-dependent dehydratase [Mycobacteroides immunogenum]
MPQKIVIAGGHGQIAAHLIRLLAARGDTAVALIRNPDHAADVESWGGQPLVLDLEAADAASVADALAGADAAVFAAGAGPGSGPARKDTVDRAGAVLLADAAERARVRRFIQISAFGAGEPAPTEGDESWIAYVIAKTAAEEDLRARGGLAWTILRPGLLTDATPSGSVTLAANRIERGSVPRADVAAVVAELLTAPATAHQILFLTEGTTPIASAVAAL